MEQLKQYIYLMRLDKPIGILLVLWPTLWALWFASHGQPHLKVLLVFLCGTVLTRTAGCIFNDITDRNFDGFVERTRARPLATGEINLVAAYGLCIGLSLLAFALTFFLNYFTIFLAVLGAGIAVAYPFLKRVTYLPQLGLGIAFSWGIPMAFAAETDALPWQGLCLFVTAIIFPIIYDTMYAMVDAQDDIKVGIKSSAILFGKADKLIIGGLQLLFLLLLLGVGHLFQMRWPYYLSLGISLGFFAYQQYLIRDREPNQCFQAFLNNNWVGLTIFVGIFLSYLPS